MGNKVSSGKMAAASRVVQVVRPHAPLIKFPNRQDLPKPNVHEALKLIIANTPNTPAPAAVQSATSPPKPAVQVSRLAGIPDNISIVKEFPQRYRRRVLTFEEMDYIQRGGPE
ncbi:28S ribosomal protein S36, mitochondrial isoform X1 [Tachysurus ichikawai]